MVILNKRSACFSPFNFHEVKKKKKEGMGCSFSRQGIHKRKADIQEDACLC
jgi:hypothetical protein